LRKRSVNLPEFKAKVLKRCEESDCLEDAMREHGNPEVFNSAQFTAEEFTMAVLKQGCKLSMDGKGAWRNNVFVERLWRSVKYERVYLVAYDSVGAARTNIAQYFGWYFSSKYKRTCPTL